MQIEVDSHTHTISSGHAYSTLKENIEEAARNNIKLLAITDHGPAMPSAPHRWYFMNMRIIPRVIDGIGILRGVEANIINEQGELDIGPEVLERMDIVLGSLHLAVFEAKNKRIHTDTVIKAMASGNIDVFAHGGNPLFPIEPKEIAKAAAEYDVLIEVNNSSFTTSRSGSEKNCIALVEAVASYGGLLTFGTDAHIASRVGIFDKCTSLVNKVRFPPEQIISLSAKRYIQFLQSKKNRETLSECLFHFE
ncbi:PHP domain-containing protein [Desulforhopalus sp. 52FAK]